MTIAFCVDYGTTRSGYAQVVLESKINLQSGDADNHEVLELIRDAQMPIDSYFVIEEAAFYGQRVGTSLFQGIYWSGRFVQAWVNKGFGEKSVVRIQKPDVNYHLCGRRNSVKDTHIKGAIKSILGHERGTKKNPDVSGLWMLVGGDAWDAYALGVVQSDRFLKEKEYAF